MAARIGFGQRATPRLQLRDTMRYIAPPSLHRGAVWIAMAAPAIGLLAMLGLR